MQYTYQRRGALFVPTGLLLITPLAIWFVTSVHIPAAPNSPAITTADGRTSAVPADLVPTASIEHLLTTNPMAVIRMGRERYDREVREWRAVLTKQELLPDGLSAVQEVDVRYRNSPRTVFMVWKTNPTGARRALYVPGDPRFMDSQGRALARVEPHGTLVRLVTTDVFVQIHGPDAKKNSRRTIDECGFASTFALLEKFNGIAETRGVLDFRYVGDGEIDGRPTYVLKRTLPYEGPDGPFPDARMVLHLEKDRLLPVAVYSYADVTEKQLLGSYVFTQVEVNPGLTESDFTF